MLEIEPEQLRNIIETTIRNRVPVYLSRYSICPHIDNLTKEVIRKYKNYIIWSPNTECGVINTLCSVLEDIEKEWYAQSKSDTYPLVGRQAGGAERTF